MTHEQSETPLAAVSHAKVLWLFTCIGTPSSLLYWNDILPLYLERFPNSRFYAARPPARAIPGTAHVVDHFGSLRIPLGRRRNSYDRQLVVASPACIRLIRRWQPDVVVVPELLSVAFFVALSRGLIGRTRVLLMIESDPARTAARRQNFLRTCLHRFIGRRVDLFLTANESGRRYLTEHVGVPSQRVLVRPFLVSATHTRGTPTILLPAAVRRREAGQVAFLYVGQLTARKGVSQYLRAIARLAPRLRAQAQFWFAGEGDLRPEIEAVVGQHRLHDAVKFLGPQPYEQLGALYDAADVFVMPTLDDYRALVGFEAIAHGLPMLHSRFDGAQEEVTHDGRNGFCIDPRDETGFADRIAWMIQNPGRRAEMGDESRALSANFTVETAVDGIAEAIHGCRTCSSSRP